MKEYSVIGKRLPRTDASLQVTGQSKYAGDMVLPGMLFGKILKSPYPHANILSINTSKAEALPGVKAVITGKDTLGLKYSILRGTADKQLLAVDKVRYIGDEVAAVAAIDEDIAEEALDLIEVEYEELPAVFDADEAMKEGAPRIHDHAERNICLQRFWNFGDVEKGFRESDYIREDRFTTQVVVHGFIEPHACLANYDSSGRLTIWASCQAPFLLRRDLSRLLGKPFTKIRVIKPPVGAGFGGKTDCFGLYLCAALLSEKTGRPVKIVYTKTEEFTVGSRRLPMTLDIKTGVKKDGTLVAQQTRVISDGGFSAGVGAVTAYNTGLAHMLPYRLPNFRMELYRAYTNKPYCGAMRGHGQNQVRFAIDCQLDMICEDLGLDPVEVSLKNALQTGDVTVSGLRIISSGFREAIQKVAEKSGWSEKRGNRLNNRGVGMGCGGFVCGARIGSITDSGALIKLNEDGSIILLIGAADTGQGCNTVLPQIVAEVLGVTLEDVNIVAGDTETTPFDAGAWSSRTTFYAGNAAKKAAEDVRNQLAKVAGRKLKVSPENLEFKNRWVYVKDSPERKISFADLARAAQVSETGGLILGRASYYPPNVEWPDPVTHAGNASGSYSFSAQVAEVEVDRETGQVKIIKMTMADDCGYPLNPMLVEGQMEGSVSTAQGQALFEELQMEDGHIINPSYTDYRMPTALDTPEMEGFHIITNDPEGPFGAKEVGEGFILSAQPAIANAIHDATGVWVKDLPITPEKVLKALKDKGASKQ